MPDDQTPEETFLPYAEILVDWDERLAREGPFFQRAFSSVGAQRVLDCACGTGHHVRQFVRWGLDAVGSDASPVPVEEARRQAREAGAAVRFEVADLPQLPEVFSQPFDAVTCRGTLPLAGSPEAIRAAVAGMRDVLRPDGLLLVQCRNFGLIPEGRTVMQGPRVRQVDDREILLLEIFRKIRRRCDRTRLVLEKQAGEWATYQRHEEAWALAPEELEGMLADAGFGRLQRYGACDPKPFDPENSPDLIVVARKAKA
ncbi:MAG: class I SAM-dependent methyltransferase [Phycisphaerae bacterium]